MWIGPVARDRATSHEVNRVVAWFRLNGARGMWVLIAATWALVLGGDLFLRLDVAVSVLYLIPIAMTLWIAPSPVHERNTSILLGMTLVATALCALMGADPQHAPGPRALAELDQTALANRAVGALAQIVTALVVTRQQRARALERDMIVRLKQALRASGEFVAVASHELKTPLTGARGYAQLLLRRAGRGQLVGMDGQSAEALRLIDDLLLRLNLLTDDLLQVSRLDAGRFDIQPTRVDIAASAHRVANDLTRQAPEHTIQVHVLGGAGAAYADDRRVEQVLTNLIGNAVKYSPAGGPVEVTVAEAPGSPIAAPPEAMPHSERAEADAFANTLRDAAMPADSWLESSSRHREERLSGSDRRHIVVSVRDEGIGIPKDEQSRLFQRFARAANASEAGIVGTGLGLYLCRALVEAQGGRVWLARSEPGHGSTFSFTLPAWQDMTSAPQLRSTIALAHTSSR